jgi:hypothetical protein
MRCEGRAQGMLATLWVCTDSRHGGPSAITAATVYS